MTVESKEVEFLCHFEPIEIRCPNPECSNQTPAYKKQGNFRTGFSIEVFAQNGMETISAFVLGMREFSVCGECNTVVPVPCLFKSEQMCEYFLQNGGYGLILNVWNGRNACVFPSHIGLSYDIKIFQEKKEQICRLARNIPGEHLDRDDAQFLFLETALLGHLSRSNMEAQESI